MHADCHCDFANARYNSGSWLYTSCHSTHRQTDQGTHSRANESANGDAATLANGHTATPANGDATASPNRHTNASDECSECAVAQLRGPAMHADRDPDYGRE